MAKIYYNSADEHEDLLAKLKEFRNNDPVLRTMKNYQIADQIDWTHEKFSKALRKYTYGISLDLKNIFIEQFGADPAFFVTDFKSEVNELKARYSELEENFSLQVDVFEASQQLHEQENKLHQLRLDKLRVLVQTDNFQKELAKENKNGILHTILRIFAV